MATLPELLQTLVENNGSDLHITTDTPPQIRVHGHMKRLDLPALGIHGNSHMLMQDRNSNQLADLVIAWLDKHVDAKKVRR